MRRRQIIQAQQRGENTYPGPRIVNTVAPDATATLEVVTEDLNALPVNEPLVEVRLDWRPEQRRKRSRR